MVEADKGSEESTLGFRTSARRTAATDGLSGQKSVFYLAYR